MIEFNGCNLPDNTVKAVPGNRSGVYFMTDDNQHWFTNEMHKTGLKVGERGYYAGSNLRVSEEKYFKEITE
ncbi:hypothetical protein Motto_63 [Pseudomonas phage Motto]|nr:hypothetical protein Motto_63 [Pseudomonas phage Motto]